MRAHRPAHEPEVHHRELARPTLDLCLADHQRVAQPRLQLRLRKALCVRAQVVEAERIARPQVGLLLHERAWIGELCDSLTCAQREMMTALRADAQMTIELIVAVMRSAGRTGVWMLATFIDHRRRLVLDRDVDARLGHGC
jgi:hypothetical protein